MVFAIHMTDRNHTAA